MKIAVVGATGLVGRKMLEILEERNFPVTELLPVASEKSVGKSVVFKGENHKIVSVDTAIKVRPDLAIFSAGSAISLEAAPRFAKVGTTVIDNSSAWRMQDGIPLIIPEVNGNVLTQEDKIIANPNCSTIQMLVALAPIHRKYGIERLIVSTYQSVTGTDVFLENDYTKEEMKLVNETHKILDDAIRATATAVRVPVVGGHSESINIELKKPFKVAEIKELLSKAEGIIVQDDVTNLHYPMPITAYEKDEVFVGRIRRDTSCQQALNLWVVSDNIRKGAATVVEKYFLYICGYITVESN